ncbi:MAG: T9SS type A sorting domain-containing protein, partial [Bacteroidota bacterium]
FLTGSATDPDGDALTYSWEEMDAGLTTSSWNTGAKPYFRSYIPTTNVTRFFPNATVVNSGNYTGTRGEYLPSTAQTLNFRFTARDNKMGGGGVCYASNQVIVDASGPFTVTYPSATGVVWYSSALDTVKWDVNGTDQAPVACDSVRILISFNSGTTYSVLMASTPNDGYQMVTVPTVSANITTCRIKVESKGNVFYDIGNNVFTITTDAPPPPSDVNVKVISKENNLGLQVYPNPFKQSIYLSASTLNSKELTNLTIRNVLGQSVFQNQYKNKSQLNEDLNLSDLPNGVYFIQLVNGNQQSMIKLVKE